MIRGVVSEAGLSVEHAPDGLDALKKASALKPQVMIVDVGLTGIYGFELCERLKGDPDTRSIKIILLSSVYGLTAYKRNPVTLYGADDYIEKHHIPDKLVSKIKQLLSGRTMSSADASAASPAAEEPGKSMPEPRPQTVSPPAHEARPVPATPIAAAPLAAAAEAKRALQDVPDVMPRVPVTLDGSRKRTATPSSIVTAPKAETTKAPEPLVVPPAAASPVPRGQEKPVPMQDESVQLDATFFEQDEYIPSVKAPAKVSVDPQEVEKARRFARLVVSDIALYNQEAVADGIAKGTFYDLLKDDIMEGRALYEKKVPEEIRLTQDYFQEAFDNFIAAKKKQR
jgi:CheY-like chemotaxis protein